MVEGHGWTELQDGDEFAGYRIERRLGRGGMGILYLAIEPGLDRRVALKLIVPEAAADEVFARRFAEESRIAASIEHPNVVPIYAAGEHEGVPYIAMRYVSGSDLSRRIAREGRLEPAAAAALIAQVGNGLDAIHAAGLVHRDVKPANVLLSGSEHAYITDFGVARNVATESGLTQTGRFVGTLDYVAPEQISGAAVDARVDVYALGCLLFKLLTGEVPYPREGEAARLYAHLNDPPPAPSLYAPAVPMALDDVVIRAMSKAPEDRYPSAGDLGRAAVAALRGDAVAIPERTVATGAAATREAEAVPEPPTATRPSQPQSPTTATRRLEPGDDRPKGGSPPGRRLLFAGGALAVAAVAVLAIVLSSGGGSDPGSAAATTTQGKTSQGGGEKKNVKRQTPKPKPLTEAELIAKGDAVCAHSQEAFKEVRQRFPNGEEEPDPAYSRELVGISTREVREFNDLTPPPSLEDEYKRYVQARERVHAYDEQALSAAQNGDAIAYARAREKRDVEEPERHAIATAIGFEVCSAG
ncbi:MAG TPA: protein kinase [Solirubrobacterales bacterium]|jgi:serine/threonine protein kinase|nr:protein kinase [Solirubrobacterales bacterium]